MALAEMLEKGADGNLLQNATGGVADSGRGARAGRVVWGVTCVLLHH
jgi:hypothetical protein